MKTFEEFNYFSKIVLETNDTIIEEFNNLYDYSYNLLNEKFRYNRFSYKKYDGKGYDGKKYNIPISSEYERKYIEIESTINKYLRTTLPIISTYNTNEIECDIIPTRHWFLKFYRKEFEDPNNIDKLINPNLYDGIKIIANNVNEITKRINHGSMSTDTKYIVRSKDNSLFTTIIVIDTNIKNGKKLSNIETIDITLLSQFKGRYYKDNKLDNINLHPVGDNRFLK